LASIQNFIEKLDKPRKDNNNYHKLLLPVVILGERGTGKESIARLIHAYDRPNDIDFNTYVEVLINGIAEGVLEGELFGITRINPSDTKENNAHPIKSYIEKAQGGTLFIDEIGKVDKTVQAKLLRFLQEGKIHSIGNEGNWKTITDLRPVFATNLDLRIKDKDILMDDFMDRIDGMVYELPNLCERVDEHELLVDYFFNKAIEYRNSGEFSTIEQEVTCELKVKIIELCKTNVLKGNIRQLKMLTQSIVQFSGNKHLIGIEDFDMAVKHKIRRLDY